MSIKLSASIGNGGSNKPHDIALLHAALKTITGKPSGPGSKFRKIESIVDGTMKNFKAELAYFLVQLVGHMPRRAGGRKPAQLVRPYGDELSAINRLLGAALTDVKAIEGTGVLYCATSAPSKTMASSQGRDFVMPERLSGPLGKAFKFLPFVYQFENVRLPTDDFISFDLVFPRVKFLDGKSLQKREEIPETLVAQLKAKLLNTPWTVTIFSAGRRKISLRKHGSDPT